jgi:hypothetical protein
MNPYLPPPRYVMFHIKSCRDYRLISDLCSQLLSHKTGHSWFPEHVLAVNCTIKVRFFLVAFVMCSANILSVCGFLAKLEFVRAVLSLQSGAKWKDHTASPLHWRSKPTFAALLMTNLPRINKDEWIVTYLMTVYKLLKYFAYNDVSVCSCSVNLFWFIYGLFNDIVKTQIIAITFSERMTRE